MADPRGTMKRPLAVMMSRTLHTIAQEATLVEAARLMRDVRVGGCWSGLKGTILGS